MAEPPSSSSQENSQREGLPEETVSHPNTVTSTARRAKSVLSAALVAQGRASEAEPFLVQNYEAVKATSGLESSVDESLEELVEHFEARGESERASEFRALLSSGQRD